MKHFYKMASIVVLMFVLVLILYTVENVVGVRNGVILVKQKKTKKFMFLLYSNFLM